MTCDHCRSRLLELPVDRFDAELGPHLAACPACAGVAETLRAGEADLHRALDACLDRPRHDAVARALAETEPTTRRFQMFDTTFHVVLLAAAAAAVGLLGLRTVDAGGPERPDPIEASTTTAPDTTWQEVAAEVDEVEETPWNALGTEAWGERAAELLERHRTLATRSDLDAHRAVEVRLLAQVGRAAENANDPVAPFYAEIDGSRVNAAWYLAARRVAADPQLAEAIPGSAQGSVKVYVDLIEAGKLPSDADPFAP